MTAHLERGLGVKFRQSFRFRLALLTAIYGHLRRQLVKYSGSSRDTSQGDLAQSQR